MDRAVPHRRSGFCAGPRRRRGLCAAIAAVAVAVLAPQSRALDDQAAPSLGMLHTTGRIIPGARLVSNNRMSFVDESRAAALAWGRADGVFTWFGEDGDLWSVAQNWTGSPGIPDGPSATAIIDLFNVGGSVVVDGSFRINRLVLSDPLGAVIRGPMLGVGTLVFAGVNPTIEVSNFPRDPRSDIYFGTVLGDVDFDLKLAGTNGLTVSGGPVAVRTEQYFSGGLTINNGRYSNLFDDSGFGDPSNSITLNNGHLLLYGTGFSTARTFTATGTSTITLDTIGYSFGGNVAGSGTLTIGRGLGTFTGNNTYSGVLRLGLGTTALADDGAFASALAIDNSGTLVLAQGSAGATVNRIGDTTPYISRGAAINLIGSSSAPNHETIGAWTIDGGTNYVLIRPGAAGSSLTTGTLTRSNGAGLAIRAQNLGQTPGPNVSNLFIANGSALLRNGVIPFAYANNQNPSFIGIESEFTNLVTYGASGVQMLTGQAADFTAATSATNVRLTSNTLNRTFTVPAGTRINTLVLAPGLDAGGNGVNGITVNGGTLHVDGGVILSATSGYNTANEINAAVGNIINARIDAGAQELFLLTPGALTTNGPIHGSGGVTKLGGRTWFANGLSDYSGVTKINGLSRFKGNVLNNTPGPYGSSSTPIELYAGNALQHDPVLGAGGFGGVTFGPDAGAGAVTMDRGLIVRGDGFAMIRNFAGANGTFTMNGSIQISAESDLRWQAINAGVNRFVLNGPVSGPGRMGTTLTITPGISRSLWLTLNSANTFSGGFDTDGGTLEVGNDLAFGTGTFSMSPNFDTTGTRVPFIVYFHALAPRTIANPLLLSDGTLQFVGSNPVTFSGEVDLDGAAFNNSSTATVSFAGNLHRGNFIKSGLGTVVLSGNNDYSGALSVSQGMVVLRSNNAAGSIAGQSEAFDGGAIALENNVVIPDGELFVFRGDGVDGLGALRSLSGHNVWGGRLAGIGTVSNTIGVDSGATLTVIRALTTNTGTLSSFPITKVGTGQMNVGSSLFDTGTSQFSVSMLVDGPLTVAAGTLRVSQVAPDNDAISRVDNVILGGTPAAPTSKLDLSNTSLIINAASLNAITAMIKAGLENGGAYDWNGNGIASGTAAQRNAQAGSFLYGLGVLRNNLDQVGQSGPIYTEFGELPLSINEILVKYTYFGDADLSGAIDATDYSLIDNGYVNGLSGWINGDFDYSGTIDATDYALIDNAFINQGLPLGQIQHLLAQRTIQFGQAYLSALAAIQSGRIPEPAGLLAGGGAVCCLGCSRSTRRRRTG